MKRAGKTAGDDFADNRVPGKGQKGARKSLTDGTELDNQGALIRTHRDRVGDPSGRRGGAGRCGASSSRSDALRRAAYATRGAACRGFRAASRTLRDAPHRHGARSLPKTSASRLYESLLALLGIRRRGSYCGTSPGGVAKTISVLSSSAMDWTAAVAAWTSPWALVPSPGNRAIPTLVSAEIVSSTEWRNLPSNWIAFLATMADAL